MDQKVRGAQIKKRKYKKSTVTRENVFRASLELMEKNGFQGTTIRDICERADVSVGTFYSYFKTKNDVLRDIYLSADNYFLETVTKEIEGLDCLEQLRAFTRHYARLNMDTGLDVMRVIFNPVNEWFTQTRPMQEVLLKIIVSGQAGGVIRDDTPAKTLVGTIFDLLRGLCYSWCTSNAGFDLEARMMERSEILIAGIYREKSL